MATIPTIIPCLWFDDQVEETARFYVAIFDDSRLLEISRYDVLFLLRPQGMKKLKL